MLAIVTSLYASVTALLFLGLCLNVVKLRRSEGVGLGDGGNKNILHAMRLQANLVEYAPISLILLLLLELNQASGVLLHSFGVAFLIARVMHAWGFSSSTGYSRGRFIGTLVTWLLIIAMTLTNAFLVLRTV